MEDLMSKNKFFKKLLVAGLCALTATATIGGTVACKKDDDKEDPPIVTEDEYTVTWNLDGGKWPTGYTAPSKVQDGAKITAPTAAQNPTKDGYTFVRWESSAVAGTAYNFDTVVEGNVTLKAIWKKNDSDTPVTEKYTVTIDLDGGTWEGQTVKDGKITLEVEKDGDLTALNAELAKLTKTGFEYGYLTIKDQSGKYDWSAPITADLDLKVVWKVPHKHEAAEAWSKDANGHWHACKAEGCETPDTAFPDSKAAHTDANHDGVCDAGCGHDISASLTGENVKFKELVDEAANTENTTSLVLAETFLENRILAEHGDWGTAGLTQGHKSTTSKGEYVEIKDNKATLVTDTLGATYLYADFGDVSASVVKGYFEISSVYGGNTYTPVQFTSSDNEEPIGLRSGSTWGYRVDGATKTSTLKCTWAAGGKVYFEYDTTTNIISVTVNGEELVKDQQLTKAISGIKFSSGDSNDSTYAVNNVVIVKTPVDVTAYKTILNERVTTIEALMTKASIDSSAAKNTYDTEITAAKTPAECDAAYDKYYAAVLSLYKTAANNAINTAFHSSDYETAAEDGKHPGNVTQYTAAKAVYDAAMAAPETLEAIDDAYKTFVTAMQGVQKDEYYERYEYNVTIKVNDTDAALITLYYRANDTVNPDILTKAIAEKIPGREVVGYYEEAAYTNAVTSFDTTSLTQNTDITVYVKLQEATTADHEKWFVPDVELPEDATEETVVNPLETTYAENDKIMDNTLFTLSAGTGMKYSTGKDSKPLKTIAKSGKEPTFNDVTGVEHKPNQGIQMSSDIAKPEINETTGDVTSATTASNVLVVKANVNCTVYLYVSLTNSSHNSDRAGEFSYTINDGEAQKVAWGAKRNKVQTIEIVLKAGETAKISVTNSAVTIKDGQAPKAETARLWLFGAEAVKEGATITPATPETPAE